MENKKEITIELKSEPMNEMLSHPPTWIVRSGNSLFFVLLLTAILLSWVIEYPDEITGEVIISTSEPPIELTNQVFVQLKKVAIKDQQTVKKGQVLAEFDNNTSTKDIQLAQKFIKNLNTIDLNDKTRLPKLGEQLNLGILQNQWSELQLKIEAWNSMYDEDFLNMRIRSMEQEIIYRQRLKTISSRKIKLSEKDYNLIQRELESSERLANENAISKQSLYQDRKVESQALQAVQNQKEAYVQNLIQLNSLQKEIRLLKHDVLIEIDKIKAELKLDIITLKNNLKDWEKSSIWIAPCNGKVIFNKQLQIQKFYNPNEASIVIVPNKIGFSAIASIPSQGAGKVKKNQIANIELIDYPKIEFGSIKGYVKHMTLIDKEGKYEVNIKLPEKLITSFKKSIPIKAQLKGTVKIITKKKRLLERFFEKIIDIIK